MRAEAIELLACLASQSDFLFFTTNAPGGWSPEARKMARDAWQDTDSVDHIWREVYAEAEARLREVARG